MPDSLGPSWGLVYGKALSGTADASTLRMPSGTSEGFGGRVVTAQTSVGTTCVWGFLCPLANGADGALGWGWGQQDLWHYGPVGLFIPQISIEHRLCTRPYTGSKASQTRSLPS